jgi:dihydrofolate reductase
LRALPAAGTVAGVRDLVYYIGVSIDGVIAGPDDEVDFFVLGEPFTQWMAAEYADALPTHVRRAMGIDGTPNRRFDTIVMGRRTYDPARAAGIVSPYAHLRQVVVSRTLESPAPEVTVVRDDPLAAVRALKAEDGLDVYLAGGGHLAGQLLGEIDRLVVKQYPVVAGAGRPAFGAHFAPTGFVLDDVRTFPGGPTVLTYSRAR